MQVEVAEELEIQQPLELVAQAAVELVPMAQELGFLELLTLVAVVAAVVNQLEVLVVMVVQE
jgi:Na+-transporting NADH:ubiquinone oxidoreductase subunit NqrE